MESVFVLLEQDVKENGYIDFITMSSSLQFSMKYKLSIDGMRNETLYNNVRKVGYAKCRTTSPILRLNLATTGICSSGSRILGVWCLSLVDPPCLSTNVGTYRLYWRLAD